MALPTWQRHVERLEKRLAELRHDAIEDPELATFHLLAQLRRNIANLHSALRRSRHNLPAGHETAYGELRDCLQDASDQPVTLAECYDALAPKNEANSKTLDHEMQLVIGSVTVKV